MLVATLDPPRSKIEQILKTKDMTIQELARQANMSYTTAHSLVSAKTIPAGVRLGTLKKIAQVLGVDLADIING